MSTWIIVPVRPIHKRGSKLKGVLSQNERAELVLSMLKNMLSELAMVSDVDEVLVVSRDEQVIELAEEYSALVQRSNPAKLNEAVTSAAKRAWRGGATAIAIFPSNLAKLNSADVAALLTMPTNAVLCPDSRFDDTNMIFLRDLRTFKFQFGEESFSKHLAETAKHNEIAQMAFSESFEFALKTPSDWRELRNSGRVFA
ncbi:MAG: 2-phospho-L-lactate guanylyltransferase [Candidatus Promineifilaceae bacterium]